MLKFRAPAAPYPFSAQLRGVSAARTRPRRAGGERAVCSRREWTAGWRGGGDITVLGDSRRRLRSVGLPQKVSARNLEDSFIDQIKADYDDINGYPASLSCKNAQNMQSTTTKVNNLAVVGLEAMQDANSTLEDFCRSYFMFHGLDANCPHVIFKFLPILSFTESYVYQLDISNEHNLSPRNPRNDSLTLVYSENIQMELSANHVGGYHDSISFESFAPLLRVLKGHRLLTERILTEFSCGIEYWSLERKLCNILLDRSGQVSFEDVRRAIYLKSFDYRILTLLLYCMTDKQVNELHMAFLSASVLLGEISDDLYDYEEDVKKNSFNILRMFVNLYGALDAPSMLDKLIEETKEKLKTLASELTPELRSAYYQRCKDILEEGGRPPADGFGTWSIPNIIMDEEAYRSSILQI